MRVRSGLRMRLGSLAALSLIRIEQRTPDLVPVQHRVSPGRGPVDGDGEIVEVFEVVFDGESDHVHNLKCAITGTYRKLGLDHAGRYLASFAWRYNRRYQLET